MRKRFTKIFFAGMLAAFISGAVIVPAAPGYAAEQTAGQNSQADAPQAEQNAHAGHHPTN